MGFVEIQMSLSNQLQKGKGYDLWVAETLKMLKF